MNSQQGVYKEFQSGLIENIVEAHYEARAETLA